MGFTAQWLMSSWPFSWQNILTDSQGTMTQQLHSQKRHRLAASCGFYRPAASCQQVAAGLFTSSTCSEPVEIRLAASWHFQTWCKLMKQVASSLQISTCNKPDRTTCSKSDERINADASWENQACCKLTFADLMQVVSSTCSKLVDIKFWQVWYRTTCSKSVNTSMLMQVEKIRLAASCYPQACCKLLKQ